ncbi:MAG: hypothetical protein A2175_00525 [Candidatus Nealsonbacteria bacterium RBG_13_42_11]|uniref:Uncharacterized protein n=1 Tax=Candidatus Nealsonbacteria bacterium RBG_13_42_11 TaxID=1801663 RepID=A0A1G2E0S3_9BACT|nr:MAG: hypothetical protein A2175_00525 [Candidatus Nealsonbacteria bacterium RBG_13_42_11]
MKITESKNLKWDKMPWLESGEEIEKFSPEQCTLEKSERVDEKITLSFRNGSQAMILGKNIDGDREIDLIEKKINDCLGKSYEEILNINI